MTPPKTKSIQLKVVRSVWRSIKAAADASGVSVPSYVLRSVIEKSDVVAAAGKLRVRLPEEKRRYKRGSAASRVMSALSEVEQMLPSDLVDKLEPLPEQSDSDAATIRRALCRERRDVIRNAINRLRKNGAIVENDCGTVMLPKKDDPCETPSGLAK